MGQPVPALPKLTVDSFDPVSLASYQWDHLSLASSCCWGNPADSNNLKTNRVAMKDEKWRDLCWQAMHEKDVNKLLVIFLELDRATEGKQLMEVFTETVREYRQSGSEERRAS